jgi:hypothetical protein
MKSSLAFMALLACALVQGADPPKAGKPEIFPLREIRPGMEATAWTVFTGTAPEEFPIEIVGVWRNYLGPRQDVIICKMGGKARGTFVASGMSGSPVYIDGKLAGAISLRLGQFTAEPICGITPIEYMLEIPDFDASRPTDARAPDRAQVLRARAASEIPGEVLTRMVAGGAPPAVLERLPSMTPIETPLVFSGFSPQSMRQIEPMLSNSGITPVQGGSSAGNLTSKPAAGWEKSLNPGEAVSGILVSGDMSVTGMGTVTYNDGKRVLAFGHPFYNLGPIDMPMAKSEILTVMGSNFAPMKIGNATEVAGALRQDRFAGIMGELGAEANTIPVHIRLRALGANSAVLKEKDLNFNVFVHERWTPFLMNVTLMNSLQQMNEFSEDITYRLNGDVRLAAGGRIQLSNILAPSDTLAPMPNVMGQWWGEKFSRLFLNPVHTPELMGVDVSVDLLPERRLAVVDSAWTPSTEVEAGSEIPVKVFLRPYRGGRIERNLTVKIPAGMPKGDHRILFSDAATLNLMYSAAASANRYLDLPETVSLLNQERSNNRLYVSLVENRPSYYSDDKTMPSLPPSVLNVMQADRTSSRALIGTTETAREQLSLPFDDMVQGSYSLRLTVR